MKNAITFIALLGLSFIIETNYTIIKTTLKQNAFSPTKYRNGLIFTSRKPVTQIYKLYYSEIINKETLGKPKEIKSDNSLLTISNGMYIPELDEFYFTANNKINSNLAIYKCEIKNYKLIKPKILDFCRANKSYGHTTFSKNGLLMIIITGDSDNVDLELYTRKTKDHKWVYKKKLNELNSPNFDLHPNLANDSLIIFTRVSHKTRELDLYSAILNKTGHWSKPEKYDALNSNFDDFGAIFINENSGYFTSNRDGEDQIYYFEKNN